MRLPSILEKVFLFDAKIARRLTSKKATQPEKPDENVETEQEQARANFPRYSLKQSLRVAQTIWDKFAGNPTSILNLASELKYAPKTTNFKYLLRASSRYGLTKGLWNNNLAEKISLSPLGKSIVAPTVNDDVNASYRSALETPQLFHKLHAMLNGKIIPPDNILVNTIMNDYGLSRGDAPVFLKIFLENVADYNLAKVIQGKRYFNIERLSPVVPVQTEEQEDALQDQDGIEHAEEQSPQPPEVMITQEAPRVFISHSKNKKIVEQIKQMLEFGKFEHEVAEERETTAIPISDKVFGLMRKCNCAIINVSADEEKKREDGTFGINENVLIEIGGAFLHYDKRVILLVDKRFKDQIPSNIKGLYMTFYEGDDLSWDTGMRLQKALTEFRSKI